ncbi:hypothetical protein TBLA_0B00640 [Henningerozyma blattae CBS 6284]|uniref:chitin synthase n=1 Tax=Henningerozyma blattae (strain ATCC 34711 / CBS 6284 / DSM 70876 / NBRC 10599 / NRRL Y-10934 / UCD 77-7) TaxID=1071380 RepID=I2GXQ5_HENB6|nr:hypothetical protein TBLA_0B00640 [Tetrapisispora blattae CBS 6284]CCH58907.1 hypothetical protein TBLA_0B00640 [Tetrapisispora blattae CBS 6284]
MNNYYNNNNNNNTNHNVGGNENNYNGYDQDQNVTDQYANNSYDYDYDCDYDYNQQDYEQQNYNQQNYNQDNNNQQNYNQQNYNQDNNNNQRTYSNNNSNTRNQNNNILANGTSYSDIFIQNTLNDSTPTSQTTFNTNNNIPSNSPIHPAPQIRPNLPRINVVSATPDVLINSPSSTQYQQQQQNQNQSYNDDNLYYNHINSNNPYNSQDNSILEVDQSSNDFTNTTDTRPILNANEENISMSRNPTFSKYVYDDDDPLDTPLPLSSNAIEDPEVFYVDQNGDNYELNTYLDRDGNMVDPYTTMGTPQQQNDGDYYGNKLYSSRNPDDIRNKYSHVDLGEYEGVNNSRLDLVDNSDDITTLQKLKLSSAISSRSSIVSTSNSSTAESNDNLLNVKEFNIENVNTPKRRNTVLRKFKLSNGNFVFDSPISKSLLGNYTNAVDNDVNNLSNEFKFMRYQAITCEPQYLQTNFFSVRQLNYPRPRQTEMMIVITMYNEDHILLGRTLKGVMDNVRHMVKRQSSSVWGPDAWKKIVVCIVSDGRAKINEKSLALLSSLGCYQDGFAKDEVDDKPVKMHVYEHTTMMNITKVTKDHLELNCDQTTVPIQLLFCLKEKNKKKINSHRWAFEGFANLLNPNIVCLLDAGTMPGKDSIYELWKEFLNPQVGGACGEIKTDLGKGFTKLINPLVASQNFEYKMSNILDKTTESNFGFITVLPGAFSAYRLVAVSGEPLTKYFYGEHMEEEESKMHFFSSNMYLAEDRILCFEIVTKRNSNWLLKYCRSSYASTDVPERVPEFILQRRRWLNGSFFASIYSFAHFYKIWTSGHNIIRKFILNIEFLYLLFNTIMSWFSLSSFFLVFRILTLSIALSYHSAFNILSVIFLWLYGVCVFSTFVLSLGNKPKNTESFYVITCVIFAVLMVYLIFCSIFMTVKSFEEIVNEGNITFTKLMSTKTFRDIAISMMSTYVLYVISSLIYLQPWHMLTSFMQYILLSPSYINVLNIYAFCNVHDISWGTKGAVAKAPLGKITSGEDGTFDMEILISSTEIQQDYDKYLNILHAKVEKEETKEVNFEEKKAGYYGLFRSLVIIFWVITNFIVVALVLETGGIGDYENMHKMNDTKVEQIDSSVTVRLLSPRASIYFAIVLWLVALNALIRLFGCVIYMCSRISFKFRYKDA